jgi:hypothetical protein
MANLDAWNLELDADPCCLLSRNIPEVWVRICLASRTAKATRVMVGV